MKPLLLFDFDGTLADTLHSVKELINTLALEYGYLPIKDEEVNQLRNGSFLDLLKRFDLTPLQIPFFVGKVRKQLESRIQDVQPFEGIKNTITSLSSQGFQLGILTSNSEINVKHFLETHGIGQYFSFIYSKTSIFGKAKVFRKLMKDKNLLPSQIIYFGDEVRDIEAVKEVHIPIVAVTWGYNSKEFLSRFSPEILIDKPEEIITVVNDLSG